MKGLQKFYKEISLKIHKKIKKKIELLKIL